MKLRHKIGIAVLSLLTFACTDLDTENYDYLTGDQYPENEEQAIRVANPVFARVQGLADWGGWWRCQEITADYITAPSRGGGWEGGGTGGVLHQHAWGPTGEAMEQRWRLIYEPVPRANRAIELLEMGADENSQVRQVLAQTIIARAYLYYLVIDR